MPRQAVPPGRASDVSAPGQGAEKDGDVAGGLARLLRMPLKAAYQSLRRSAARSSAGPGKKLEHDVVAGSWQKCKCGFADFAGLDERFAEAEPRAAGHLGNSRNWLGSSTTICMVPLP